MKPFFILLSFLQLTSVFAKDYKTITKDTLVAIEENVIYKITHDPKNYFISVETDDKKTFRTILREGVTIYFDIKGKRKKKVFVRYPNKLSKPTGKRQQRDQRNTEQEEPSREESLENLPQEAMYSYFNTEREFHILLNDLSMSANLDILDQNRIKYSLKIPKHKINDDPKKNLSKLTIGVLIGRDTTDESNNEQRPGGGQSGMQMGGGMSGGGGGGRGNGGGMSGGGGGRSGGGMSGGGRSGGGQQPSQENRTQPAAIWFEANPGH